VSEQLCRKNREKRKSPTHGGHDAVTQLICRNLRGTGESGRKIAFDARGRLSQGKNQPGNVKASESKKDPRRRGKTRKQTKSGGAGEASPRVLSEPENHGKKKNSRGPLRTSVVRNEPDTFET